MAYKQISGKFLFGMLFFHTIAVDCSIKPSKYRTDIFALCLRETTPSYTCLLFNDPHIAYTSPVKLPKEIKVSRCNPFYPVVKSKHSLLLL
jgi:hypothetical protein